MHIDEEVVGVHDYHDNRGSFPTTMDRLATTTARDSSPFAMDRIAADDDVTVEPSCLETPVETAHGLLVSDGQVQPAC